MDTCSIIDNELQWQFNGEADCIGQEKRAQHNKRTQMTTKVHPLLEANSLLY